MDPFLNENERTLSELLKHFTYRPGWRFEVHRGILQVSAEVIDADDPDRIMAITFSQGIPSDVYKHFDWTRWLFEQVRAIEFHELQEFFRIDGRPVYEPHPELVGASEYQRDRYATK